MIKKNRRKRFTHSLGEIETKEKGDTMVVTEKGKRTKESLGSRLKRFERKVK